MADLVALDLLFSQRCYLYSQAQDTMICTGVGGGKTLSICLRGIHLNYFMPGNQGLICADTETHLEDTTKKVFFEICPPGLIVKIDRGQNFVRLRTKDSRRYSTIYFRHLNESRPGRKHLSGLDLGWYSCDQLEDCEKDEWDYLMTRLRKVGVDKTYRFAAMNSKGKDWCYRRYFQPALEKGKVTETKVPGLFGDLVTVKECFPAVNRYSIIGPTEENIHLPKDFIENMKATQTKEYLQRYLYAGFEEWAGKIYKDFSRESKHNNFSFPIPKNFPCIVSIDVGGDSPWAILVGRQDPFSGDLFITDELYQSGLLIREVVSWLRSRETIPDVSKARFICDPENKLAIVELAENGIGCDAARKGPKLPGILRVGGYMKPKQGRMKQIDSQPGPDGTLRDIIVEDAPTLWVFKDKCPNFIREHDEWAWQRQPGTGFSTDKPVDGDDHCVDALIYLCRILPAVETLPKLNPAMEALRRIDPLSYEATKQIQAGRVGLKFSQTGGEAWAVGAGGIDGLYKDIDLSRTEW